MKRLILLIGAAILAGGCGRPSSAPEPAEPTPRRVRVLNWEEYIDPSLLPLFTERTGIEVEYDTFGTQDEGVGLIRSDPARYDLVVIDDSVIKTLMDLQLLRPIETEPLRGLAHLDPPGQSLPADLSRRFAVPYLRGFTVLGYRKDHIPDPPASWNALWDERYRGRIMMPIDFQENFAIALLALGHPMNSGEPQELDAARERLIRQAPLVREYADGIDAKDALLAGEAWIGVVYNGDILKAAGENDQVGYALPSEGLPLWVDCFVIPRDGQHIEEAMAFIDFMLDPEVAAQNAGFLRYATPNRAARALLPSDLMEDPAISPPADLLEKSVYYMKPDLPRLRAYNSTAAEVLRLHGDARASDGTATP
jgi:spermidine/putrescine transport system substrate-binding protein